MIFAAVTIATDGDFVATQQQTVGLFIGLLVVHGLLNVSVLSLPSYLWAGRVCFR